MIKIIRVKPKIKEIFSNFVYRMPDDPELILYDFYFLTTYGKNIETNMPEADFAINEAVEQIIENLHAHMLKAVKYALCAEIRHIFDSTAAESLKQLVEKNKNIGTFIKTYYKKYITFTEISRTPLDFLLDDRSGEADRLRNVLSKETDSKRKSSYRAVTETQKDLKITNSELSKIFEYVFLKLVWQPQFGGPAWADIAKAYYRLLRAKRKNEKIIAIDHAYDLQHNTDTVFNKLQIYYKDGYSWIKDALDWKRDVKDIRSFYNKVSPQLRRIVAFIAYNVYGLTMEGGTPRSVDQDKIWTRGLWKGGTWTGEIWKYGIWEKGTWKGGTWKDGIWKDGTWEDGIWKDGIWKNGTWKNGTWKGGTWESGSWRNGIWEDGIWKEGDWENGTWKDGFWMYGYWKNGTWKSGTWKDGIWKSGTWKNGTWRYGTWKSGTWKNGTWRDGIWENGTWEDGTWFKGVWKNGTWKNGTWENGFWKDGVWEGGIWKSGEIWNPETDEYEYSDRNPYECEWSLSYRKG